MGEMNAVVFLSVKGIKCGLAADGAEEVWFVFPDDSLCEHEKAALCFCVLSCSMEMIVFAYFTMISQC